MQQGQCPARVLDAREWHAERQFRADSEKPVLADSPERALISAESILTPERTENNALRTLARRCAGTNGLRAALIGDVYCPEWVN